MYIFVLQFFMELMKVPRVESKLRVFSFKIQFHSQVWRLVPFLANHELYFFALPL
jgi:hypothetical protein